MIDLQVLMKTPQTKVRNMKDQDRRRQNQIESQEILEGIWNIHEFDIYDKWFSLISYLNSGIMTLIWSENLKLNVCQWAICYSINMIKVIKYRINI